MLRHFFLCLLLNSVVQPVLAVPILTSAFQEKILAEAHEHLCRGDNATAFKTLDAILLSEPLNQKAFRLRYEFAVEEYDKLVDSNLSKIAKGLQPTTELERLFFAESLLVSESADIQTIRKYLETKATLAENESTRLNLLGLLAEIEGDEEQSAILLKESLAANPYNLDALVTLMVRIEAAEKTQGISPSADSKLKLKASVDAAIKNIEKKIPKGPIAAVYQYYLSAWNNRHSAAPDLSPLEQSYNHCPKDFSIATHYAGALAQRNLYQKAYKILLQTTKDQRFLNGRYYLQLAAMATWTEDIAAMEKFLTEAEKHRALFSPTDKKTFSELQAWLKAQQSFSLTTNAIAIALLALVFLLFVWVMRRNSKPNASLSAQQEIDQKTLETAEKALQMTSQSELISIATFSSTEGYTQEMMTDLIFRLQSKGIAASYEVISMGQAFGVISQYHLRVPKDQVDQALELLSATSKPT